MKKIAFQFTLQHPKTVIAVFLMLTIIICAGLPRLSSDVDFEKFLPEHHPVKQFNESIKSSFGLGKNIVVSVKTENPAGIYNPESLTVILKLTNEILDIPEVIRPSVMSLATERYIIGIADGMKADFFMEDVPEIQEDIAQLRHDILDFELYVNNIVSEDGKLASIIFEVSEDTDNLGLFKRLEAIIEPYQSEENTIYLLGDPIASGLIGEYIGIDMGVMMPIAGCVVLLMLFVSFRDPYAMMLPFLVVLLAVAWTFGLRGWSGIPINMLTPIIPIILMAIGDTDAVHLIHTYYQNSVANQASSVDENAFKAVDEVSTPLIMTSLTTMMGFLSLGLSSIPQIKQFGVFTAFGVFVALVASLFLVPALIVVFKMKAHPSFYAGQRSNNLFSYTIGFFSWWGRTITLRKHSILVVLVGLITLTWFGIRQLEVDDVLIENFKKTTQIYQASTLVNERMNGTSTVNLIFSPREGDTEEFFKQPENLAIIEDVQNWVESNYPKMVGDSLSITDFLKRIRYALNNNDPTYHTLPQGREETAQLLLLYNLSGEPEDFEKYVDTIYEKVNVFVYLKQPSYRESKLFYESLFNYLTTKGYDKIVRVELAGQGASGMARVGLIIDTLKDSLLVCLAGIFLLCSLMFRSFVGGLLNVIVVSIALMINFSIMGALGIDIAVGTAIVSSIIIGIGVDFSIHVIAKYKIKLKEAQNWKDVTSRVLISIGPTIFVSSIVMICGFLVLLFSQVPPTITIGALMALAMLASFIGSIFFLPVFIYIFKPKFLLRK